MSVKVTKEFTFDAAHVLTGHNGLCSNLHGHTYKALITVTGEGLATSGSSAGMVVDFQDLKRIIGDVIAEYDHAFLYNSSTSDRKSLEIEVAKLLLEKDAKVKGMPFRTTVENMAMLLGAEVTTEFKRAKMPLKVSRVRLYETPTSYADAEEEETR